MKKFFNFVAMTAVVLLMASCNDDVNLHKFKIVLDYAEKDNVRVDFDLADQTDNSTIYAYGIEYKSTFMRHKAQIRENLKDYAYRNGATTFNGEYFSNLVPETDYIIYACETGANNNPIGELEYITVRTTAAEETSTPYFRPDQGNLLEELEGTVALEDGILSIYTSVDEGNGDRDKVELCFYASSFTGSFGIKDVVRSYAYNESNPFLVYQSKEDVDKGKEGSKYGIFDLSIRGYFDQKKGKYIYDGWIKVYVYNFDYERFTIHAECDNWKSLK